MRLLIPLIQIQSKVSAIPTVDFLIYITEI